MAATEEERYSIPGLILLAVCLAIWLDKVVDLIASGWLRAVARGLVERLARL